MRRQRQRGSVSVEFALVAPLIILLLVGGVHFGKVLMTRHELTEATNYATRAAAVGRISAPGAIRTLLLDRLDASDCTNVNVTAQTATDGLGLTRLEVTATCTLDTGIGGNLLGAVGPDDLSVTGSMPF
jgi:Flp pilus assembly protein TadG